MRETKEVGKSLRQGCARLSKERGDIHCGWTPEVRGEGARESHSSEMALDQIMKGFWGHHGRCQGTRGTESNAHFKLRKDERTS